MMLVIQSVILIIIIVVILYFIFKSPKYEYLVSSDGIKFKVLRRNSSHQAVEILSELNRRVNILIEYVKKVNLDMYTILDREYDFDDFRENGDETFTIGKGESIDICIRNPLDLDQFIPINEIMFVVIHELAHIVSKAYDHIPEFWRNNIKLLGYAQSCRVYIPIDYRQNPLKYCNNITINDNPLFDEKFKQDLLNNVFDENKDLA